MIQKVLSVIDRIKGFLFSPTKTFDVSKEDTLGNAVIYFITLLMICAVLSSIVGWPVFRYGVTMAFLIFLLGLLSVFIGGLWTHMWVYLFGGRKGVTQTLKALLYGATPGCVLGWIPIVGIIAVVWGFIVQIVGIKQLQEMPTIRAVLVLSIAISIPLSVPFAATGTWRLGFTVESWSMKPNMHPGDLIIVVAPHRTSIETYEEGKMLDHSSFNEYGDVIIYRPNGLSSATPIIHRAMYWVEEGEEIPGGKPAPHAGYITKGDNNPGYDQQSLRVDTVNGRVPVEPVKPEWVVAVAKVRVPYLGYPSLILKDTTQKIKGFIS
ncbi:Signal peptidase I [Candidatus Methanophagaceae archaeon]|nr:Signal peptidase I [Methanophagales archaeon]